MDLKEHVVSAHRKLQETFPFCRVVS